MATPSQLFSVDLPDNSGKTVTYYTYDGYLEEADRNRVKRQFRSLQQLRISAAAVFGLVGYAATRRLSLPVLSLKGYSVPVAGLFSGFLAGGLGYDLFTFYKWSKESSLKRDAVLAARYMPLWSNLRNAVNPDRAFFELADERHNEPLVFHSGLTPESAARIIPDKILGEVPQKPHSPSAHGHH